MKSLKTSMKVVLPLVLLASIFVVASVTTNVQPAKEPQTAVPELYSDINVGLNKEPQTGLPDKIDGLGHAEIIVGIGDY